MHHSGMQHQRFPAVRVAPLHKTQYQIKMLVDRAVCVLHTKCLQGLFQVDECRHDRVRVGRWRIEKWTKYHQCLCFLVDLLASCRSK